jgi:hypothetical protein
MYASRSHVRAPPGFIGTRGAMTRPGPLRRLLAAASERFRHSGRSWGPAAATLLLPLQTSSVGRPDPVGRVSMQVARRDSLLRRAAGASLFMRGRFVPVVAGICASGRTAAVWACARSPSGCRSISPPAITSGIQCPPGTSGRPTEQGPPPAVQSRDGCEVDPEANERRGHARHSYERPAQPDESG